MSGAGIPAEAVEAAAKVMYAQDSQERDMGDFSFAVYEHDARAILEAAAPRLMEEAWEEGHDAGFTFGAFQGRVKQSSNPYRKAASAD